MSVAEFTELLRLLERGGTLSPAQRDSVNQLVTILAPHKDMELASLIDLFRKALKPKRRTRKDDTFARDAPIAPKQTIAQFATALRCSFDDDAIFAQTIAEAKSNRALTLAALKATFEDLFGRQGNFRSKATRDDVLRKILDERNIKVRNEKMGQLLGRRPVPAE